MKGQPVNSWPVPGPGSPLRIFFWFAGIAAVYFIAAMLSMQLVFEPEGIPPVWPVSGIFLSALLLTKRHLRKYLVAILFSTDLAVELLAGSDLPVSLLYSFSNTFDAALSTWLLIRILGEPLRFEKVQQVIGYLFLSAFLANAMASMIAAAAPYLFLGESYWASWKWCWSADAVGNLLVTPFIMSWAGLAGQSLRRLNKKRIAEGACLVASVFLVHYLIFIQEYGNVHLQYFLDLFIFPIYIWAAFRFRVRGVTLISVILTINLLYLVLGPGTIVVGFNSILTSTLAIQLYVAATALLSLILAAAFEENKKTSEEVRKVTFQWNRTFDAMENGIAVVDARQIILQSNRAFREMTGMTADQEGSVKCSDLMYGKSCPYENCLFTKMKLSKSREITEMEIGEIAYELIADPVFEENGDLVGAVHVLHDITGRKRVEDALHESEVRFRTIFEESPIGIEIYDAKGMQVAANRASFEMFGITDDSSASFSLFSGTSLREADKMKLLKGEPVAYHASFDFDRVKELGQYNTWRSGKAEMEYLITPLKAREIDSLMGYLLQVQEVTGRIRNEMIQRVLYNIANAVVTTRDIEGLIATIREQLGLLVDTTNFYVAFYDEETRMFSSPYVKDELDGLTSWPAEKSMTGQVVFQNRSILLTPEERSELIENGTIQMIGVPSKCWLGVPLRIDGKVIGAFVVQSYDDPEAYSAKDMEVLEFVSDQISMSIQRKRIERDLVTAREKALEADRLKSAFLANMSHEIRTPMNAIVGFAEILTDPELSQEERRKYSGIVQSRSEDLMLMINDLLEISRIESGNVKVNKESIQLNALIEEISSVYLQRLSAVNKTKLALEPEKALPDGQSVIHTDGFILKQVFSNLIENAIKYTPSGSIRFGYKEPSGGLITFFVSDTGIGISPENQKIIFEHFRQAEIRDQHQYGGTGLGLSICRGSLALLGGEIWVESEPGKGSTFYFTLPFVKDFQKDIADDRPGNPSEYDWKGKRVLLVEDEVVNMEYLRIVLGPTGAELICAFNGREVREMYGRLASFDLVLLDIRLPDASGWDLAREIKAIRPELAVIAQTAYAMAADRERSRAAGCDNYISKPVERKALLNMVSEYLK